MVLPGIRKDSKRSSAAKHTVPLLPPRVLFFALVAALIATVFSFNTDAAEQQSAARGPGFPSAEAAFVSVFLASGLGERAYRENREYAAAIYQMPDGSWYCTAPSAGSRTRSAIPYHAVPDAALQIIGAHTHGQPRIPEDPWHLYGTDFSQADLRNAVHNYRITHGRIAGQLLLTSELKVLRLTLTGQPDLALGEAFVASPEDERLTPGAIHGRTEIVGHLPM